MGDGRVAPADVGRGWNDAGVAFMTQIVFKTHGDQLDYVNGMHVLTFAEQGFAPLDIHGRRLGINSETLIAFAEAVNQSNKVGSLYPQAPISAVPRSCIRDTMDSAPLLRHLQEFTTSPVGHIKVSKLLLDFSTPRLPPHVEEAIAMVFGGHMPSQIDEVIVIRN